MGCIHDLLAQDHRHLDRLLARAGDSRAAYDRFRASKLRHIAMEERILLPAARRANGGEPIAEAEQLRVDHGRIASLLTVVPTARTVAGIAAILATHERLEEPVYAACELLLGAAGCADVLRALRDHPSIRVTPIPERRRP